MREKAPTAEDDFRETLEVIASISDMSDFGWWTEQARKVLARHRKRPGPIKDMHYLRGEDGLMHLCATYDESAGRCACDLSPVPESGR